MLPSFLLCLLISVNDTAYSEIGGAGIFPHQFVIVGSIFHLVAPEASEEVGTMRTKGRPPAV